VYVCRYIGRRFVWVIWSSNRSWKRELYVGGGGGGGGSEGGIGARTGPGPGTGTMRN
jgi:hypothetical protein